ncbi:MAG: menaquinone biosynthesis protein [Geobacteraceae bacterium]|nr:menaquinone biosynthesis protein [Geobacteraceae bacterium]
MSLLVGQIDYANCTPIFTALRKNFDCSGYRFIHGVPSRLNLLLSEGKIDLSPSSSIVYGRSCGQYLLLPDLSITADGPVRSVLLFSRLPFESLGGETICLTSDSETSVVLLKVILAKYYGFTNRFVVRRVDTPADALRDCTAVLVIGDTALKWASSGLSLYRYDLGEMWHSLTGLPFVFALWILRKDAAEAKYEEVARLSRQLGKAKRIAVSSLESIGENCSERGWMDREDLIRYWESISYDLSARHIDGVTAFFRGAMEVGILTKEPEIRFFDASGGE